MLAVGGLGSCSDQQSASAVAIDPAAESQIRQIVAAMRDFETESVASSPSPKLADANARMIARMTDADAAIVLETYAGLIALARGGRLRDWKVPSQLSALLARYQDVPFFSALQPSTSTTNPLATRRTNAHRMDPVNARIRPALVEITFSPECTPPASGCALQAVASACRSVTADEVVGSAIESLFPTAQLQILAGYLKSCLLEHDCSAKTLIETSLTVAGKALFPELALFFQVAAITKIFAAALTLMDRLEGACVKHQVDACCRAPSTRCGSECSTLDRDDSCGECDKHCDGDKTCDTNRTCACAGQECNGRCVVTRLDFENCGGCGVKCDVANGFFCSDGVCRRKPTPTPPDADSGVADASADASQDVDAASCGASLTDYAQDAASQSTGLCLACGAIGCPSYLQSCNNDCYCRRDIPAIVACTSIGGDVFSCASPAAATWPKKSQATGADLMQCLQAACPAQCVPNPP